MNVRTATSQNAEASRSSSSPRNLESAEPLPFRWRLLAAAMCAFPTEIRRVDVLWRALYSRIGGGEFEPNAPLDAKWPSGLQPPIRGKEHRFLMRLNLQNWSDRRTYFSGRYYQQDISRLLISMLRRGDQYVDIGANIGMTMLSAAAVLGPHGRGLAFEPNPEAFARLKQHAEINGLKSFHLVQRAIDEQRSTARLFIPGGETLLASLAPQSGGAGSFVDVETAPIDEHLVHLNPAHPTLIKIDVEGYEVQVLKGIGTMLRWPEVAIVSEVGEDMLRRAGHSREELHRLLADLEFQVYRFLIVGRRWRKELILEPIEGPLDADKYDAFFVRPNSRFYRERVEPFLVSQRAGG